MYICIQIYIGICVHVHKYICIYIYICVCVCVYRPPAPKPPPLSTPNTFSFLSSGATLRPANERSKVQAVFSPCLALRRAQRIERAVGEAEEARAACA